MNRSIPKQLINGFIETELELFKKQCDESPFPEIQEYRSFAIAWLCYFFKDFITKENSSEIIKFVDDVYDRKNYRFHGWYRIPALEAAAFMLTSNDKYANKLVSHIACEQSWARRFVIESAGIICPLLYIDNQYFKKATEKNIEYGHSLTKENLILYLSSNGPVKEKINWLNHQVSIANGMFFGEFFKELEVSGYLIQTGFFIDIFSKSKSYLIFKILSKLSLLRIQPDLFTETAPLHNFENLFKIERTHPLSDCYIDFKFLIKMD